jgi:hypothetical protein
MDLSDSETSNETESNHDCDIFYSDSDSDSDDENTPSDNEGQRLLYRAEQERAQRLDPNWLPKPTKKRRKASEFTPEPKGNVRGKSYYC